MINLGLYLIGSNIFEYINKDNSLPFINDDNKSVLNNLLIVKYGDKTLYSKFELLTVNEIAEMILLTHKTHWLELVSFKDSELNPFAGSKNVITETITETGNIVNNNDRVNKVSAYNDDELIVNDGDSTISNEQKKGETIRTLTSENFDYRNAYNNLSLSDKTNILKIVIKDIADFLTLTIY